MGASRNWATTGDEINCGSDASLDNIFDGGGTWALWVYNTDTAGNNETLMAKDETSGGTNTSQLRYSGASQAVQVRYDFSTTQGLWITDTTSLPVDNWHHVVMVYDCDSVSNDPSIYIDGVSANVTETSTPVGTRTTDAGENLYLGNVGSGNRWIVGDLSHAQVWNRSLSASEVTEVMFNPGSISNGLVLWIQILGNSTEYDISGNGNNGTVTGTSISLKGPPVSFPNLH